MFPFFNTQRSEAYLQETEDPGKFLWAFSDWGSVGINTTDFDGFYYPEMVVG